MDSEVGGCSGGKAHIHGVLGRFLVPKTQWEGGFNRKVFIISGTERMVAKVRPKACCWNASNLIVR